MSLLDYGTQYFDEILLALALVAALWFDEWGWGIGLFVLGRIVKMYNGEPLLSI